MTNRKQLIEEILGSFSIIKRKIFGGGFNLAKKLGITPTQWQLLHIIIHHKDIGVKEIAEHLGNTSSAATQMIDRLVEDGLLIRESNAEDRRALNIKISNKSKKHLIKVREKVSKHLSDVFSVLSDKELEEYNKINKIIIDKILERKKEN